MPLQVEQVTLDGSGNGTVRFPPVPPLRPRLYLRVTVSIDTGITSLLTGGEARMYNGEPLAANFMTGTTTPWLDTATLYGDVGRVMMGQYIAVQFTNCDPSALATVTAEYVVDT